MFYHFITIILLAITTHSAKSKLVRSVLLTEKRTTYSVIKKQNEISVSQFGAKGDGHTDDTEAIQKAIDYASRRKIGTVTFSNGHYRISKKSIIIKQGILLKGIDKIPAKSGFGSDLCQFEIYIGKGGTNKPAFIVESFSGMAGFSFLYPEQSVKASIPTAYGWTITTNGNESQDGIVLRNLMLTNSYLGIKLDNGGQHTLENIFGQPIKTGIYVDRQYDVLRINNIHFWAFYTQPGQSLYSWIESNGIAIILNRTDGLQGSNWFAYGYHRGLYLANQGNGMPWLTVTNILFDVCVEPIVVDAVAYMTLNNVTLTGTNVAVAQTGLLISEKVDDINSIVQINGLTTVNLTNSFVNKGVCTVSVSMKSKVYDGKNNGVRWYDIINENDKALFSAMLPLRPGDDFRRVAGKVQINGAFTYQNLVDITPDNFNNIYKWEGASSRVTSISGGSQLNLVGDISVVSYLLPTNIRNTPGVYLLELTIKEYSSSGVLGLALFYPRLRDYSSKIDYPIVPFIADPYFLSPTKLKIPFIISDGNVSLDFVFGRATNTKIAYIDVTNMRLYKASGSQSSYVELMPNYKSKIR